MPASAARPRNIVYHMLYWSKCLIGVSSFWNGLLFFFRPPAYLFAKKRTLNNELTKGGLTSRVDGLIPERLDSQIGIDPNRSSALIFNSKYVCGRKLAC